MEFELVDAMIPRHFFRLYPCCYHIFSGFGRKLARIGRIEVDDYRSIISEIQDARCENRYVLVNESLGKFLMTHDTNSMDSVLEKVLDE